MSQLLINEFLTELARIERFTANKNEQTIREAFKTLLQKWARQTDMFFVAEHPVQTPQGKTVYPDGTILHKVRVPFGYAINLKREFLRIPFYPDFKQWAAWGERLMELHIGYETVAPYALTRDDVEDKKSRAAGVSPKPMLKADKEKGTIRLDSETTLSGIPPEAWDYRLGNRSGLEWILDQYKEKKPRDPTIREKFNTYRFVDYKEHVIDLLMRVTTVSVETMAITDAMKTAKRDK